MIERLDQIEKRYEEIEKELMSPDVMTNIKLIQSLSKEKANLLDQVIKYREYKKILSDIEDNRSMLGDKELGDMCREELVVLEDRKLKVEEELNLLLVPTDENDDKNVIIEIRGAAGGDEGNIFAGDLFDLYTRYAENHGYKWEVLDELKGEMGGYSSIQFMVKGNNVYSKLKYESGAHRVQRVPETESQGRIHTSTATVLVMPEAEEIDIELKESDIKIDITRSSGAGGQSVNTTDSAVRMTHIPTGITVYSQTERSQIKNRERALVVLKTKVYEAKLREEEEKLGTERKIKIGTGDRSEKIRTYNYPQNRITDHRINYSTMQLDRIMASGKLDEIIEALINEDLKIKLQGTSNE